VPSVEGLGNIGGGEFDDDVFSCVHCVGAVCDAAREDVWEDESCHCFIGDVELQKVAFCNNLFKQWRLPKLQKVRT
jgi:hypothetical protein